MITHKGLIMLLLFGYSKIATFPEILLSPSYSYFLRLRFENSLKDVAPKSLIQRYTEHVYVVRCC
jgi:hypothetical protein